MHRIEVKVDESDEAHAPSTFVMPSAAGAPGENNEAHVLARFAELRENDLWNSRHLKCVESERNNVSELTPITNGESPKQSHMLSQNYTKIRRPRRQEQLNEKLRGRSECVQEISARLRKAENKHLLFVLGQIDGILSFVASKSSSIAAHDNDEELDVGSNYEKDNDKTIAKAEKSVKKDDTPESIWRLRNMGSERRKAAKEAEPPKVEEIVGEDEKMEVYKTVSTTSEITTINVCREVT
ncbi:hypothetical protein CRE_07569 [Caenorhabditis remanei]|uniref:Uncharacterized protein n=1 Tax=Caenorhabditis remanei TaxID=31234 RepID=E3MPA2_CAERE|nr:hypothetical protein CRE_07569 [Caenorhabditis remanei]